MIGEIKKPLCSCCCYRQRPNFPDSGTSTTLPDTNEEADEKMASADRGRAFLPPVADAGIPHHVGNMKQLYCQRGFNLAVSPRGDIYGTQQLFHRDAVLEITSEEPGQVRIMGHFTRNYVAMNEDGMVYAESNRNSENCVWDEKYDKGWNIYKKPGEQEWYLGINKTGSPKRGHRTKLGNKSIHFLPRIPRAAD